jgi:queuosine precursor transporter
MLRLYPWLLAAAFLSCVPLANWMIGNIGTTCVPNGPCLIPVGFGLMAPSGVLAIGAALALRDAAHERFGRSGAAALVLGGSVLSLLVAPPALALASTAAFVLAELLDLAVYDRVRRWGRSWAVLASGLFGAALDTALFSWLAFGSLAWQPGLLLGKIYASLLLAAWWALRDPCRA